jgi:NAD(P)-dependent dehydrogenase (short-subunit alcohol dehydrogenase family)
MSYRKFGMHWQERSPMMDRQLFIVTGASRGLGASVALWLRKAGAVIVLVARSEKTLKCIAEQAQTFGGILFPLKADISVPDACQRVIRTTNGQFGPLDALVNNAGVLSPIAPVADSDMQCLIRNKGPKNMPEERVLYFQALKSEGRLQPPYVPARSIAWLALRAPRC